MFFAKDERGIRTYIDNAIRNKTYFCPACNAQMIIKRGKINAPHFAHKTKVECDPWYCNKMSVWHKNLQSHFSEKHTEITVWNSFKTEFHIADSMLTVKDKTYIFEFQHSPISYDEFNKRSSFYLSLGYILIWVFDFCEIKNPKKIFYDTVDSEAKEMHMIWPGRDRIRFLDNFYRSSLTYPYPESNLRIFFHVRTGKGQEIIHNGGDFGPWSTWEYGNPFFLETYFVEVLYPSWDNLYSFYANYYTENEFYSMIRKISELSDKH